MKNSTWFILSERLASFYDIDPRRSQRVNARSEASEASGAKGERRSPVIRQRIRVRRFIGLGAHRHYVERRADEGLPLPLKIAAQGLLRLSQRRIAQFQEVLGRRSSSKAGGEVCAFEAR